jgi:hypothetical protein
MLTAAEAIALLQQLPPETPLVVPEATRPAFRDARLELADVFRATAALGGYGKFQSPRLADRNRVQAVVVR